MTRIYYSLSYVFLLSRNLYPYSITYLYYFLSSVLEPQFCTVIKTLNFIFSFSVEYSFCCYRISIPLNINWTRHIMSPQLTPYLYSFLLVTLFYTSTYLILLGNHLIPWYTTNMQVKVYQNTPLYFYIVAFASNIHYST
jgi:hypothetical protein